MVKMIPIGPNAQTPEQRRPHIDMPDTTLPPGSTFVPKKGPPQAPVTAEGLAKAGATGVRGGAESVLGGDLPVYAGQGAGWLAEKLSPYIPDVIEGPGTPEEKGVAASKATEMVSGGASRVVIKALEMAGIISPETSAQILAVAQPTQADVASGVTDPIVEDIAAQKRIADRGPITSPEQAAEAGGPKPNAFQEWTQHQAENPWEQGVQTAGGFVGAAAMPGTVVQRVARPILAATGVELAGAAVPEEYEEAARIVAGLAIGAGMGANQRGFKERSAMRKVGSTPGAGLRVRQLLKGQGLTDQEVVARMKELGSEGMLLDVGADSGAVLRQEAQRLYAHGGEGARGVLGKALETRKAGQEAGLQSDVEAAVGARQQPSTIVGALEDRLTRAQKEQTASHSQQVQPVDLAQMADDLDVQMSSAKSTSELAALQKVRKLLTEEPGDPSATPPVPATLETTSQQVLKVRQAIRDELYEADGRQLKQGLSPGAKKVFQDAYAKVNEQLDPANPTLRAADAEIHQIGKEEKAFETGQKIYENPRGAPTEVEFKQTFDAMSPGEQARILDGLNVETYRQIGIQGNSLVKLKDLMKGEGKWNQQKVAAVIGDEKAQKLMDAISNRATFQDSYQKIVQGSKTAETQAEKKGGVGGEILKAAPEVVAATMVSPWAGAGAAISNARRIATDLMSSRGAGQKEAAIAKLLTSNEPDKVAAGLKIMRERGSIMPQATLTALLARQQDVSERKGQ